MEKLQLTLLLLFVGLLPLLAQPSIYTDASTLITGTWDSGGTGGSATIVEETGQIPYEGNNNYRFDYSFSSWWAGCGLNLDTWGATSARDFSGYTHIRIAYYGMTAGSELRIRLIGSGSQSNYYDLGGAIGSYQVIDVPIDVLTNGTAVVASSITEIELSIGGVESAIGSVFFDAIELVNSSNTSSPASATTWARANAVSKGVNLANWLEAHWLIQFGAFPEVNKYNRTNIAALKAAGFETIRLPITVERITPTTAPYTVDFNHQAMQLVDSMIVWAIDYDFKLIIDNHHGYDLTDANYLTELPRLEAIWTQLASRYGNLDPDRYFFEVYNEPHSISNNNFRIVSQALVDIIRAEETQIHSVLVGASGYNSGTSLTSFVPLNDADIIYVFHNYDPYSFTHQGMSWTTPAYFPAVSFPQAGQESYIDNLFASVKTWSTTNDVPVWLGEYGVATSADALSRCNWMETMVSATETNGFAHFYWDAISPTNAFGFYNNGTVSESDAIACFKNEMGLYQSILPIEFLDINAACIENEAIVKWQAMVTNDRYVFIVEKSDDGINWKSAGQLLSKDGQHSYSLKDQTPDLLYRIKIIAADNLVTYSPIVQSHCGNTEREIFVYPNPVKNNLYIKWPEGEIGRQAVEILNIAGQTVKFLTIDHHSPPIQVNDLQVGHYLIKGKSSTGFNWQQHFIIIE